MRFGSQKNKAPALAGTKSFSVLAPMGLVFRLECLRAFHFLVGVVRVACCFHPGCQEEAAFLGFGVVCEGAVALLGKAFLAFGVYVAVIAGFVFAVAEETPVCRGVARDIPAHLGASVKGSESTSVLPLSFL